MHKQNTDIIQELKISHNPMIVPHILRRHRFNTNVVIDSFAASEKKLNLVIPDVQIKDNLKLQLWNFWFQFWTSSRGQLLHQETARKKKQLRKNNKKKQLRKNNKKQQEKTTKKKQRKIKFLTVVKTKSTIAFY